MRKLTTLALALPLVIGAAVGGGTSAHAATATCTVSSGTLTWGVKETFRSYISGSIARGAWEASDGATYATPSFTFTGATGDIDPKTGAGTIRFPGLVHFTGHGGVLDMKLARPSIAIAADGSAKLHLDVTSNDTSGKRAVDAKDAEVGAISTKPVVDGAAATVSLSGAPVTLTDTGAPAFGGFYTAGDALDPITMQVALSCPTPSPTPTPSAAATSSAADSTPTASGTSSGGWSGWLTFGIAGGAAVVLVGAVVTTVLLRRRAGSDDASDPDDTTAE